MDFIPKWIALEITPRCNLRCIHCRSSSAANLKDNFSTDDLKGIIDSIADFASPVLVLSGGEPMLRKDLYELISYGTEKGLRMCMATNGTVLTAANAIRLKEAGIQIVSLSLDGSTAEMHDNFRSQSGAFDKIIEGIEHLKNAGIEFIINSSFTQRNKDDIYETFKLSKELGAKAWYMFMIVPTGRGKDVFAELLTKEEYEEILNWHYELEKEEEEILVRPTCAPHYYRIFHERAREDNSSTERRSLSFSTGGGKGCVAAQTIAFINYKGEVMPCSYFPVSAGNILKQPLSEIWESPLFKELRDFKSYKGKCGECRYLGICGGCRARAYAVTGDYMDEEPFCDYEPSQDKG